MHRRSKNIKHIVHEQKHESTVSGSIPVSGTNLLFLDVGKWGDIQGNKCKNHWGDKLGDNAAKTTQQTQRSSHRLSESVQTCAETSGRQGSNGSGSATQSLRIIGK